MRNFVAASQTRAWQDLPHNAFWPNFMCLVFCICHVLFYFMLLGIDLKFVLVAWSLCLSLSFDPLSRPRKYKLFYTKRANKYSLLRRILFDLLPDYAPPPCEELVGIHWNSPNVSLKWHKKLQVYVRKAEEGHNTEKGPLFLLYCISMCSQMFSNQLRYSIHYRNDFWKVIKMMSWFQNN